MKPQRLLWQLFFSYLVIILLSLSAVTWHISRSVKELYHQQLADSLLARTQILREQLTTELLANHDYQQLQAKYQKMASQSDCRVTLILATGKVIVDSDHNPALMENHLDRPEIIHAMEVGPGHSSRFSKTLREKMMYLALPIYNGDKVIAVVRTAVSTDGVDQALHDIYREMVTTGAIVAACAVGLSLLISRRISRPIELMNRHAQRFALGELTSSVPEPDSAELAALSRTLNGMARQLHNRIQTITDQRNEIQAILLSMVEGVWAVDAQGCTLSINQAAAELLNVDPRRVQGLSVPEMIRHTELQRFVEETLNGSDTCEADLLLPNGHYIQVHGTSLVDAQGGRRGAVIVLNDITRIRRLESLRRDFVANVSHELKTPITSLKGFVETLLDGAVDEPDQARRFLEIIAKQADRLHALVEDLLCLTRIEEDREKGLCHLETAPLKPVLASAIEMTQYASASKNVTVHLECPDDLTAKINGPFLEQAIVNLVDNAIKYSESEKAIKVAASKQDTEIIIVVKDQGQGIADTHLERIFERFYVVDKARSRKVGGTGLGLAIVKHTAQAHNGYVTVESKPGFGSTFAIHLPA